MSLKRMFKKVAGALSPAYGIATGEGAMGKASRKGMLGAVARAVTKEASKPENKAKLEEAPRKGMLGAVARAVTKGSQKAEPAQSAEPTQRPAQSVQPAPAGRRRLFSGRRTGEATPSQENEAPEGFGKFSSKGGGAFQRAAAEAVKKAGGAPAKMAKGGEVLTAAQKRMLQEVQDAKDAKKAEKAYNDSLSSPEMVMPKKAAPKKDSAPVQKRAMGGMMNKKGYAAGGVVKARGMGAATRGGKCKVS